MSQLQRKVFRALTADTVEKRFIAAEEATPAGWKDDQIAALAAYQESSDAVRKEEAPEAPEEVKPRRGRPRKEQ